LSHPERGPDRTPAGPQLPPRREGLSDAERAKLGEPPGRQQHLEELARKREEEETRRLEAELDEVETYRMPLMEHLIELRDRLIKSVVAVAIGCGVGLAYAKEIYDFLTAPFILTLSTMEGVQGSLSLVSSPFEGVSTYMRVGMIAGMVLASPVVSYQLWQFVAPGLYKTEKNIVVPLAFSSVALFLCGAGFCYYVIFPYAFPFFIQVLGVDVNLSVDGYLTAVIRMMLAFGACFQLPVGAFFFARIGLIDHRDMIKAFRYAVVVIAIVAAIITPPDVMSQMMIGIPMVLLYIIGIGIAALTTTKVRGPATLEGPEGLTP
jgi:sec-independent protein translocase protein TatC